jgi:hypothetical protein
MNVPFASYFSVQPEILYNNKGAVGKGILDNSVKDIALKLDYLSVPIMFQYNPTSEFYLEIGPEFSFLMNAKMKANGETVDYVGYDDNIKTKDKYNKYDFGLSVGMGYYFSPSNIGIAARLTIGFTDIAQNDLYRSIYNIQKNNVLQIGIVYKFINFGKTRKNFF